MSGTDSTTNPWHPPEEPVTEKLIIPSPPVPSVAASAPRACLWQRVPRFRSTARASPKTGLPVGLRRGYDSDGPSRCSSSY